MTLDPTQVPEWTEAERAEYRRAYLTGEPVQQPTHPAGEPCDTCEALRSLQREAEAEDDAAGIRSTSTPRAEHGGFLAPAVARAAEGLPAAIVQSVLPLSWNPSPWRHPIAWLRTRPTRRRIRRAEAEAQRRRESSDPTERLAQKLSDGVTAQMADALLNGRRER